MFDKSFAYKKITSRNFKGFGWLIDYPDRKKASKTENLFRIVVRQPKLGWRIAYLVVRDRKIGRLEQHPGSLESFEPVKGKGLLFVSKRRDENAVVCFLLDKPVVLKRGIWHGVIALTPEFDVKITENSKVKCVYWRVRRSPRHQTQGRK